MNISMYIYYKFAYVGINSQVQCKHICSLLDYADEDSPGPRHIVFCALPLFLCLFLLLDSNFRPSHPFLPCSMQIVPLNLLMINSIILHSITNNDKLGHYRYLIGSRDAHNCGQELRLLNSAFLRRVFLSLLRVHLCQLLHRVKYNSVPFLALSPVCDYIHSNSYVSFPNYRSVQFI